MADHDFSWLSSLFLARTDAGDRAYSDTQIEDLVAATLMTVGYAELTPSLANLMTRFAERAGVEPGDEKSEAQAKITSYFETHPIAGALRADFERNCRQTLVAGERTDLLAAFSDFAENQVAKRPVGGPRPEGAVGGGALGFFAARRKLDEE